MSASHSIAVLIPAYRPAEILSSVIDALAEDGASAIILVDDGSGPEYRARFDALATRRGVTVLRHAVNLGKGAALKTGLNHALCEVRGLEAVVTADADGQHHPDDIRRVAEEAGAHPGCLVLGARQFRRDVPLRSRIGNTATRRLFSMLAGQRLNDTQTGLRGIPVALAAHLLRVESTGYEFELDMLLQARQLGIRTIEVPIRTIYLEGNASSHFNPILDSMRIYFVLLRFGAVSLVTALVDNVVFLGVFHLAGSVLGAQAAGRVVALVVNYLGSRRAVFFSRERHRLILPKYLLLVAGSGVVSYGLIRVLHDSLGLSVIAAKLLAESTLFIANFTIQRDFVFTTAERTPRATDWDSYYASVPPTAKLTRRYTTKTLLQAFQLTGARRGTSPTVVEIGGANSCFVDRIVADVQPAAYHVVDTNRLGLEMLRSRPGIGREVVLHDGDVLNLSLPVEADVVFSVGLIEHFDEANTRRAVQAHFRLLKPGGYAIISFPTPTWLYRASRAVCEAIGVWKFHDERPLDRSEVARASGDQATIVFEKTLWPLIFTQRMMVFRKAGATPPA